MVRVVVLLSLCSCATVAPVGLVYRGPPDSDGTHRRYWNSAGTWGASAPLEMYFSKRGVPDVNWVDGQAPRHYRVLFQTTTCGDDESRLISSALETGASFGADAMLRSAETVETSQQNMLTAAFDNRWVSLRHYEPVAGPTHYKLTTSAIHYADPGTEPYTGILCSTYTPYSFDDRAHLGDPGRLAAIRGALGPAAAAGIRGGDFALAWGVNGKDATGDCWNLYDAIHAAGPNAKVSLTLWQPSTLAQSLDLTVHLLRRVGAVFEQQGNRLVVREVRPGSAAARAGMLPHDELLSIEGKPPGTLVEAVAAFHRGPVEQHVTMSRNGASVPLTLETESYVGDLGLRNLPGIGVLILKVPDEALMTGLAPGDVVTNVTDWHALQGKGIDLWPGQTEATLHIVRQGAARTATFTTVALGDSWYR